MSGSKDSRKRRKKPSEHKIQLEKELLLPQKFYQRKPCLFTPSTEENLITHIPFLRLLPPSTSPALGLSKALIREMLSSPKGLRTGRGLGTWGWTEWERGEMEGRVPEDLLRALSLVLTRVQLLFQK